VEVAGEPIAQPVAGGTEVPGEYFVEVRGRCVPGEEGGGCQRLIEVGSPIRRASARHQIVVVAVVGDKDPMRESAVEAPQDRRKSEAD